MDKDKKLSYEKPELVEHENLDEVTKGTDPSTIPQ